MLTPMKEVTDLIKRKLTRPKCHLQKLKRSLAEAKDCSKGYEAHQPPSEGVLDWGIGTPTQMGQGVESYSQRYISL